MPGSTRTFAAAVLDQFGRALTTPPAVTWTTTGGGNLTTAGVLTAATTSGGPFTVTATAGSLTGTAALTVASVPPVAISQTVATTTQIATPITLTATDANSQTLTYRVVTAPAHGTLTGTAPTLTYTAAAGWVGGDSLTFLANDGSADSNLGTVTILVSSTTVATVDATQSPLVKPAAFDAARWSSDVDYKAWYLTNPEPGRIWQSAEPGPTVPILTAAVPLRQATSGFGSVTLSVTTVANQPVTFLSYGGATFGINGAQVITVAADATGLATVTANAPRLGTSPVVAASPAASGSLRFVVVGQ
jgi:hypothetical protein